MNFNKGQSILGVILAMAIFALMASAIAGTSVGNLNSLNKGGEQSRAESLAQEAVEAIRGIKENAWNDLYSNSDISFAGYDWSFDSSNVQTIGDYTRTVTFSDVCRDAQNVIVACPGTSVDLQAKKVNVSVSWEIRPGVTNSVNKEFYLTNWDSREWVQTDWSSGPGQSVLSDDTAYDSDDGALDYSTPGEVKIAEMGGQSCTNTAWSFDNVNDYVFDPTYISVANGSASLVRDSSLEMSGLSDVFFDSKNIEMATNVNSPYHISGELYMANYSISSVPYTGYLKTFTVDSSGVIQDKDTLALLGENPYISNILHISNNIYSIFYTSQYNGVWGIGFVQTVSVDSSGNITDISGPIFFNNENAGTTILSITETIEGVFSLIFSSNSVGYTKLVSINNSGSITVSSEVTQIGTGGNYYFGSAKFVQVYSNKYVLFYSETNPNDWSQSSYYKIVDIDINGNTILSDSIFLFVGDIYTSSLIKISDGIFSFLNSTYGQAGVANGQFYIKTFSLSLNDTSIVEVDNLLVSNEFTNFNQNRLLNFYDGIYHLVYSGVEYDSNWSVINSGAYIKSFSIDNFGSISDSVIDSHKLANGNFSASNFNFANLSGNNYLITYAATTMTSDYLYQGYAESIIFDNLGTITSTSNQIVFDSSGVEYLQMVKGPNDYYVLLHSSTQGQSGKVTLIEADAVGNVSFVDNFNFIGMYFYVPSISFFALDEAVFFVYRDYSSAIGNYQAKIASIDYSYSGQLYTTTKPTIIPSESFVFSTEEQLNSFSESASKGTGEIYYQLSDDDGSTWKYWNGGYWVTAGSSNYNTASVISANINRFATSTGKLMFKAFLESDGSSQIRLNSVSLNCAQSYTWTFDFFDEYIYDPVKIQMVDGKAKLKLINQYNYNHVWDFASSVGYDYDPFKIDISSNAARLKYIDPSSTFNWDYNTSSTYTYDPTKVEFLSGQARLKHIGPALGSIANSVTDFENLGGTPAFASDIIQVRSGMYLFVYNLSNLANGRRTVSFVTKNIASDGSSISNNLGTASISVNSSLQSTSDDFEEISVLKIADGIIAVAYSAGYYTYVTTYSISVGGVITSLSTGTVYNYTLSSPQNVSITKVENATDMYAVAFSYLYNSSDTLFVNTISISSSGTVGSVVSTITIASDDGYGSYAYRNPKLMYLSGQVYALTYDGYSPYTWEYCRNFLRTIIINSSGTIVNSPSAYTLDYDLSSTFYNRNVSMIKLSDSYIAAVYQDKNRNGWLKTFNINSSGVISLIQSFQYKTVNDGSYPDIVSLGNDNYAIISNKVNDYGKIDTFNISATGVINTTAIDSYTYENGDGDSGQIVNVGTGIYALAYQNSAGALALSTINISSAGAITDSLIVTLVVGGGPIQRPLVTHIRDDIYLYSYVDNGGTKIYLSTKRITSDGTVDANILGSATLSVYSTSYLATKISNGYFAISYSAYITTYSVSDTGSISLVQTYTNSTGSISDLVKLEGSTNVYAIASNQYNSYIDTITISDVGIFGAKIDSFNYVSPNGGYTNYTKYHNNTRLLYISSNVYAVSYDVKQDYPTYKSITEIITINIDTNGSITQTNTVLDIINLDTKTGNVDGYVVDYGTTMVRVSNDYIAVSFTKTDGTTYLGTLNITSSGIMPTSLNYSITYGSGTAFKYPKLISLSETFYALSYTLNSQMILDTYNISTLGVITTPKIDTLTYDIYGNAHSSITRVNGNIFAIAHKTSGETAGLTTLSIEATGVYSTAKPTVVSYRDDFGVSNWTSFVETANLNGGNIYYQLSHDNINWFYLNTTSSSWLPVTNASLDYSSYSVINSNINTFITSTSKLYAKAFLVSDGTQKVGLDNVSVSVSRSVYGYATDRPSIINNASRLLSNNNINSFETFTASITNPSGGNVLFQISDDAVNWLYFDGLRWIGAVDNNQANTATEINQYIQMFSPQNKKLYMKAIFVSDGVQQVTLNSATVGVMVAPADANTVALFHMDEASGNLYDSINKRYLSGSATSYNQTGVFNKSMYFNGSPEFYASNASYYNLTSRFTIDFWIKNTGDYYSTYRILTNRTYVNNTYTVNGYEILKYQQYGIRFYFYRPNSGYITVDANAQLTANWMHIAITYDGNYIRIFYDGVVKRSYYYPSSYGIPVNNSYPLYIGGYQYYTGGGMIGYLDEIRYSNIARWTSDFTPPTFPTGDLAQYTSGAVSVEAKLPYNFTSDLRFASFLESATKNNGEIYYQLSDDNGLTWKYFDGTNWSTAGSSNYNTATVVTNNIVNFPTSTGSVSLKTIFVSDGTQYMDVDSVSLNWEAGEGGGAGGGSGGGFATSTYFISSAFDMGDDSPAQFLDWDEDLTQCTDCSIRVQVSTAPDNGGVPGTWTPWYGVTGVDTYFVDYFGSIIPNYLNGRRWVRYRVELLGDGETTPILREIRLNYK